MKNIITRIVEHEYCVDVERNFSGIWAVVRCSLSPSKKKLPKIVIPKEEKPKNNSRNQFPPRIAGNDRYAKYGITEADYERMKDDQEDRCAICEDFCNMLYIDHDHINGKVRGLLCPSCNTGLGQFRDAEILLLSASDYLNKYR